jgi:hypothetical protein
VEYGPAKLTIVFNRPSIEGNGLEFMLIPLHSSPAVRNSDTLSHCPATDNINRRFTGLTFDNGLSLVEVEHMVERFAYIAAEGNWQQ